MTFPTYLSYKRYHITPNRLLIYEYMLSVLHIIPQRSITVIFTVCYWLSGVGRLRMLCMCVSTGVYTGALTYACTCGGQRSTLYVILYHCLLYF